MIKNFDEEYVHVKQYTDKKNRKRRKWGQAETKVVYMGGTRDSRNQESDGVLRDDMEAVKRRKNDGEVKNHVTVPASEETIDAEEDEEPVRLGL